MMQGVRRFGNYYLLKKIAAGGMAELYKAKKSGEKGFEKLLAIKMILPHLAASDEFISMFIDEAKVAALLNHQNIVQIYDLGRIENSYCIVMEYVRGKDLRTVLSRAAAKGARISVEHACLVTANALAGLSYAHRKRDKGEQLHIVHRDMSPQNILISYEGEVKIVDFGIAKAATQTRDTQAGVLKGKLSYMSPEQALGKPLDMRSDVFSTGVVLYEALTGRKLFQGDTDLSTLELVREARVEPLPTALDKDIPEELEAILLKSLAKDPAARYQSAAQMESALLDFMRAAGYATSGYSLSEYMYGLFREEIEQENSEERELDQTVVSDELTVDTLSGSLKKPAPPKPAPAPLPEQPSVTFTEPPRGGKNSLVIAVVAVAVIALAGAWAGSKFIGGGSGTPPAAEVPVAPSDVLDEATSEDSAPAPVADEGSAPASAPASAVEPERTGPPEKTAPPPPAPATAVISSEPSGADVTVDGRPVGRTPLRMSGLEPDREHRVVVAAAGYREWSSRITAGPGRTESVHAALKEISSSVRASTTPPGAKIIIDGADTGKTTPAEVEGLRPGVQYAVRLAMPGFKPFERAVIMKPGERAAVEAALERMYGELNVNAKPWAYVIIDGENKGMTPLAAIRLTAGEHMLVLDNPKLGLKKNVKVTIRPDDTTRVVIDLNK